MGTTLKFTGSIVKSWFQYRCERKVIYDAMPATVLEQLPELASVVKPAWLQIGHEYEHEVVAALRRENRRAFLGPSTGDQVLPETLALGFLRRTRPETIAYQMRIRSSKWLAQTLDLSEEVIVKEGRPDLVLVESEGGGPPIFRIVDVKAAQVPTLFHRAQIAFYSLLLRGWLQDGRLDGRVSEYGEIWHLPPGHSAGRPVKAPFPLRGYEELVIDFFRRNARKLAQKTINASRDETSFHIYFKCEACSYLPYCARTISGPDPSEWDISSVPGVSHESKATLLSAGIRTVGQLATGGAAGLKSRSWALSQRAETLQARARSLVASETKVLEHRYTLLMPPRVDLSIFLVVDADPVEGNLLSLGCLIQNGDEEKYHVRVLASNEQKLEADALLDVLTEVAEALGQADANNTMVSRLPVHAHIFVYEPAEAADLQRALGRHLDNSLIRKGLLQLVRIFPPEQVIPEPEYKGAQHLPATALRTVIEQTLALPVKVSYDLRQVTQSLGAASPPLIEPYEPEEPFARHFSARLSVDVGRALRKGELAPQQVEEDVTRRLRAMKSLTSWLVEASARAAEPFLRLKKDPFRFQATINPLDTDDLDILLAHQLLESRSALLACLISLAQPSPQRTARFRCYGGLTLERTSETKWGYRMRFRIPPESADCELSDADLDLILTRDDPDIRLDPVRWADHKVRIVPREAGLGFDTLVVAVSRKVYEKPSLQAMLRRPSAPNWHVDEIYVDRTTSRLINFLRYLGSAGPR